MWAHRIDLGQTMPRKKERMRLASGSLTLGLDRGTARFSFDSYQDEAAAGVQVNCGTGDYY
jgi:hypothetical protein